MKPGRGKQKGGAFERLVCKHLSLWISEGKASDLFWRSAMSGGRATVLNRRGKKAAYSAGDITATGDKGFKFTEHFFVECKTYASLDILGFLLELRKGKLSTFWNKAVKEAETHGKKPMLIGKQNGLKPFVLAYPRDVVAFDSNRATPMPVLQIGEVNLCFWWLDDLFPLPRLKPVRKPKA